MRRTVAVLSLFLLLPACRREPASVVDGYFQLPDAADAAPADAGDAAPLPDSAAPDARGPLSFKYVVIDDKPDRPAYVTAGDLDGDGKLELVVSVFSGSSPISSGALVIYHMNGGVTSWSKEVVVPKSAGVKFPNAVTIADVDGDQDPDLLLPYGFLACVPLGCGGLAWLEQTGAGWKRHDVVPGGSSLFYHRAVLADVDADGQLDLVTVGESKGVLDSGQAVAQIFGGDASSAVRFATQPQKVGPGLGSLPSVRDMDGDGDLDIVSAEYFVKGESAAWYEQTTSGWTRHVALTSAGPSIQLSFIDNLLGDGQTVPVLANHTNTRDDPQAPASAVFMLKVPADPTQPWQALPISQGIESRPSPLTAPQGAPGVFDWGDLDGDGDLDLVVAGDGDPNIYWLEQRSVGSFATHVLMGKLPQAGVAVADLDGDGTLEVVVSSYEANRLLLFRGE